MLVTNRGTHGLEWVELEGLFFQTQPNLVLGALVGDDDGMRNSGAWARLGQLYGFMSSQNINVSSCHIRYALKCSSRGKFPVPQF